MKQETFIRGVGEMDDRILERYHTIDARLARKHTRKRIGVRVLAVAACMAILLCACVPVGMLAHPAGRAVLKGDSAALTEQLNKIEGFQPWQEKTAEKLEQTLPGPMWELLQTTPIMDVLTQSQYPAYAWKNATLGAYLTQPEMYTYYLDDPQAKLATQLEIDTAAQKYVEDSAPEKYTLTVGDAVYQLSYAYSLTQTLTHQSVHVYRLYGNYGMYLAYVDVQSGECVYWENPERVDEITDDGVDEQSMIETTYDFLAERVRDPEAYTVYTSWEGELFVCEYSRLFYSYYTRNGKLDADFRSEILSCDSVKLTFDRAGNIVSYDAGFLGSLRQADTEIPIPLFDAAFDHVEDFADSYSGTGTMIRVVLTPDGRLALDYGMHYLLDNDTYAATAKYLTYLTEANPDLADQAYVVEPMPNKPRVMTTQTIYYSQNKQTTVNVYEYDANGNLICEIMIVDGVENMRMTHVYDELGRKIETKTVSEKAPAAGGGVKYIYNEQGILIREDHFDYRGKQDDQIFFEYDEKGRVIREEGNTSICTYTYGENDSFVLLEESKVNSYTQKSEYLFDAAGNRIGLRFYDGDKITSETVYEYNEANQQTKWYQYADGELVQYNEIEYRDGKEVRTLVYRDGKLYGISTPGYNQLGECIGRESVDVSDKLIQSYAYEYGYLGE